MKTLVIHARYGEIIIWSSWENNNIVLESTCQRKSKVEAIYFKIVCHQHGRTIHLLLEWDDKKIVSIKRTILRKEG